MAAFPKTFSPVPSPNVVYNYTDIRDGSGITILYGAQTTEESTDDYILTNQQIYSNDPFTGTGNFTETSFTLKHDLDFDIQFNFPKRLYGLFYANIPFVIDSQSTETQGYIICKIRHWDGSTETDIDSIQSETLSATAAMERRTFCLSTSLTGTHFKAGEYLRITIEVYGKVAGAAIGYHSVYLGHDPIGRTGTTYNNGTQNVTPFPGTDSYSTIPKLTFHVPFDQEVGV